MERNKMVLSFRTLKNCSYSRKEWFINRRVPLLLNEINMLKSVYNSRLSWQWLNDSDEILLEHTMHSVRCRSIILSHCCIYQNFFKYAFKYKVLYLPFHNQPIRIFYILSVNEKQCVLWIQKKFIIYNMFRRCDGYHVNLPRMYLYLRMYFVKWRAMK